MQAFPSADGGDNDQPPLKGPSESKEESPCEEASRCCPICLHDYNEDERREVYGLCAHSFCQDCLERLLTAPPPSAYRRLEPPITTEGCCPLCRAQMSLFDIKHEDKLVYPPRAQWWLETAMPKGAAYASSASALPSINFPEDGAAFCSYGDGLRCVFDKMYYHVPTQTFAGEFCKAKFTVRVVLTFSYDWQFVTRGSFKDRDTVSTLGGSSGQLFRLRDSSRPPREDWVPTYIENTLFGNSFCQGFKVGLASYHFQSLEDSYISYESPATAQWPPLDNGMPIPSRVPFRNVSVNTDTEGKTTFRGHICWLQDFGTAWQGSVGWEYEILFDSEFLCIVGGRVQSVSLHPSGTTEVMEDMSTYGETLIYVNAALFDRFQQRERSPDFRNRFNAIGERLTRQGASVRTLAPVHYILMQANLPDATNPFDFNNGR